MKMCEFDTSHSRNPCLIPECQRNDEDPVCIRYIMDYCKEVEDKACSVEIPHLLKGMSGDDLVSLSNVRKRWGENVSDS